MSSNASNLHMTSVSLDDWLVKNEDESTSVWNRKWTVLLHRGNIEELEQYLTSFCYSILELSERDQVFVARTVFVSIITDLLRLQSRKKMLRADFLAEAYEKIFEIEAWENISQFILNIPEFLELLIADSLAQTSIYNDCPRLNKAMQLINKEITSRQLTVKWLSDQLEISTTHLSNLFRLKVGMNVSDYIAKRRVTEITYDIVHTSQPLAIIREKYGFLSHSHFIQFFKRHKGKTPLKYRQYVLNITEQE